MVLKLARDVTGEDINNILEVIRRDGLEGRVIRGESTTTINLIGDEREIENYGSLPGVEQVIRVQDSYKLVSRRSHPEYNGSTRIVNVNGVKVGGEKTIVIAGPCAIEGITNSYNTKEAKARTLEIARALKEAGVDMLRGGAFKPRKNPYTFQGLGEPGLEILAKAKEETGLPIVTEIMTIMDENGVNHLDLFEQYGVDVYQIGMLNMQNQPLLKAVAKTGKPTILKRNRSATLQEWLDAAEYLASGGNFNIIMCERGIRTFTNSEYSRYTLDLNVIEPLKQRTYLPVIVDPSHATGYRGMVPGASLSALAMGAHGLLIEVVLENDPIGICDYNQGITISQFAKLMKDIKKV